MSAATLDGERDIQRHALHSMAMRGDTREWMFSVTHNDTEQKTTVWTEGPTNLQLIAVVDRDGKA